MTNTYRTGSFNNLRKDDALKRSTPRRASETQRSSLPILQLQGITASQQLIRNKEESSKRKIATAITKSGNEICQLPNLVSPFKSPPDPLSFLNRIKKHQHAPLTGRRKSEARSLSLPTLTKTIPSSPALLEPESDMTNNEEMKIKTAVNENDVSTVTFSSDSASNPSLVAEEETDCSNVVYPSPKDVFDPDDLIDISSEDPERPELVAVRFLEQSPTLKHIVECMSSFVEGHTKCIRLSSIPLNRIRIILDFMHALYYHRQFHDTASPVFSFQLSIEDTLYLISDAHYLQLDSLLDLVVNEVVRRFDEVTDLQTISMLSDVILRILMKLTVNQLLKAECLLGSLDAWDISGEGYLHIWQKHLYDLRGNRLTQDSFLWFQTFASTESVRLATIESLSGHVCSQLFRSLSDPRNPSPPKLYDQCTQETKSLKLHGSLPSTSDSIYLFRTLIFDPFISLSCLDLTDAKLTDPQFIDVLYTSILNRSNRLKLDLTRSNLLLMDLEKLLTPPADVQQYTSHPVMQQISKMRISDVERERLESAWIPRQPSHFFDFLSDSKGELFELKFNGWSFSSDMANSLSKFQQMLRLESLVMNSMRLNDIVAGHLCIYLKSKVNVLRELDLGYTQLSADALHMILTLLLNQDLNHLNIAGSVDEENRVAKILARLLRENKTFSYLKLDDCKFQTLGAIDVLQACSAAPNLQHLSLERMDLSSGALKNLIHCQLACLKTLHISHNQFTTGQLGEFLLSLLRIQTLKELKLNGYSWNEDNISSLCCLIQTVPLTHLEVEGNTRGPFFGDNGLRQIISVAQSIERLNICQQDIGPAGFVHLSNHIEHTSIRQVLLCDNSISGEDLNELCLSLLRKWPTNRPLYLDLSGNYIKTQREDRALFLSALHRPPIRNPYSMIHIVYE